jgi:GrpB-like predicted nucleotidyltransferase (UPF0157 family)
MDVLRPASAPRPSRVELVAYNNNWPKIASEEAERLKAALGGVLLAVEHFGSTSVPGLAAKPVIDLMPIVSDLPELDRMRPTVERLGYEWFGEFGIDGRRFCTSTSETGVRLAHLHFYQKHSPEIERHLAFRDYLRAHPDVARSYERKKIRARDLHLENSMAYNDEKSGWMIRVEAMALSWHCDRSVFPGK